MSRILIIEPDAQLGGIYRMLFERAGHACSVVRHAQDAISAADDHKPDMVVLELQLVGHNGLEFLYEFRSYPDWQDVPVILQTMVPPHALQITQEQMNGLGIIRCLYKPATNLKQLISTVQGALVAA